MNEVNSLKRPTWLLDYKSNVYSQSGEDGVIAKLIDLLPASNRWCVEFGAWDGRHFSTTCNLIEERDFSAVLIEGNTEKYKVLCQNYSNNAKVLPLNRFVGFGDRDNLDCILSETPIPMDFDFLSIDIDGNDYHVWRAMSRNRPKLVCIEFNPTIPTEVSYIQQADPRVNIGNSLRALVELGKEKGYELVCVLSFNAIFVVREYFPIFDVADNRPEVLRSDLSDVTWLFSGYDGSIHLAGSRMLPWHLREIREEKMQQLPRFLQKYPLDYTLLERSAYALITDRIQFIRYKIRKLFGAK